MEPQPEIYGTPPPPPTAPNESSPLNSAAAATDGVLILTPHARFGRYVSMVVSSLFLLGFHGSLMFISYTNYELPCEKPLALFLFLAGVVGTAATLLYLSFETKRSRDEALLLPTDVPPPPSPTQKMLVLATLISGLAVTLFGAIIFSAAPKCAYTNPIVYNWALAALLLYGCFGGLVVLVPILSAAFPLLAVAVLPFIAALVSFANWLGEAGKRGAYGAASVLHTYLTRGRASELAAPSQQLPHPASTFALYVNTAALLWLFGFMLIEVSRSWRLPCDAHLHAFVLGAASLGVTLALVDFIADVFKDPLPPMTRSEQTEMREERKRKLKAYGYILVGVLVWGGLGLLWLNGSETCAHTAPAVYRLALLLCLVYALFVGIALLVLLALALDYCLSGKLRMVVILES